MRIISGSYGGRRLGKIRGDIRPTSDRLRESLFSILGERVQGTLWLDLFSGSGAVGIEAASRGASYVIFNDHSDEAIRLLKNNLSICGVQVGFEIWQKDALTFLNHCQPKRCADFIFLDPPFDYRRHDKLLRKLLGSELFDEKRSILIFELFKKKELPWEKFGLDPGRTLRAGDSKLLLLRPVGQL